MVPVVMSELSVAVRVGVLGLGGVASCGSHPVQVKLVVERVHGLSVRLTLVIFVLAVGRLSAVVAHVRHGRLRERRRVLGVRVATHRSRQVGQDTRDFLLVNLSGAHGGKAARQSEETLHWRPLGGGRKAKSPQNTKANNKKNKSLFNSWCVCVRGCVCARALVERTVAEDL